MQIVQSHRCNNVTTAAQWSNDALRLLGYGDEASVALEDVRFEPGRVAIGGRVSISFVVRSRARASQRLLVDVAVHFVKATGKTSRTVFKLKRVTLPPRGREAFRATVFLKVHTTRKPHLGVHEVDVIVNGTPHRLGSFRVTA